MIPTTPITGASSPSSGTSFAHGCPKAHAASITAAGPGPALAAMIEEDGFSAALYDPLFHPDESVLARTYDFITCTETVEHFATPRADFQRLHRMLVPGGWIGIMTDILEDREGFGDWYYHRDPTHVAFYSRRTFRWIGEWLELEVEFLAGASGGVEEGWI